MTTREQLAEVIRDGEGTWRTPFEAADAILGALGPQRAALDAVLALHTEDLFRGHLSNGCRICGHDYPCATVRAVNDALEADK